MTFYAYQQSHQLLTFTAQTGSKAWADAPAGTYLLFYPHWYSTDARRALQVVGKTRVRPCAVGTTSVKAWRLELETLLNRSLPKEVLSYQASLPCVILFDPVQVVAQTRPSVSCFPPLSYVFIEPFLYRTDRQARLQERGECFSDTSVPTPHDLARTIEHLTGIKAEDIRSIVPTHHSI